MFFSVTPLYYLGGHSNMATVGFSFPTIHARSSPIFLDQWIYSYPFSVERPGINAAFYVLIFLVWKLIQTSKSFLFFVFFRPSCQASFRNVPQAPTAQFSLAKSVETLEHCRCSFLALRPNASWSNRGPRPDHSKLCARPVGFFVEQLIVLANRSNWFG